MQSIELAPSEHCNYYDCFDVVLYGIYDTQYPILAVHYITYIFTSNWDFSLKIIYRTKIPIIMRCKNSRVQLTGQETFQVISGTGRHKKSDIRTQTKKKITNLKKNPRNIVNMVSIFRQGIFFFFAYSSFLKDGSSVT